MSAKQIVETTITVQRALPAILAEIAFDANNNASLKAGNHPTLDEIAFATAETLKGAEAATIRAANILRLARNYPDVKEGETTRPAFDVVKEKVRALCATDSAFYNILGMTTAIDVCEKYALPSSPFAVKETLGTLRRLNVIPKTDGAELPKKLTNGTDGKAAPVVKLLKSGGAKVNAIRETLAKVNGKPAKKKAKTDGGGSDKPATVTRTPETLKAAIVALKGEWELTVQASSVADVRKACADSVQILAMLAGFDCVPLQKKAEAPKK